MSLVAGQSYEIQHAVPENFFPLKPELREVALEGLREKLAFSEADCAVWSTNADRAWQRFGRPLYPASNLWGLAALDTHGRIDAVLDVGVTTVSDSATTDQLADHLEGSEQRGPAVIERIVDRGDGSSGVIMMRDLIAQTPHQPGAQPRAIMERYIGARVIEPGLLALATLTCAGLSPIPDAGTMVGETLISATISNGGS
jgi:hypothetical protein